MSQPCSLDRIIQRLQSLILPKIEPSIEKIVIIDAKKEKILPKEPWVHLGRDLRRYLVSTQNTAEWETECEIKDVSTEQPITINITCKARCEPGNEDKVVLALFKGDNPDTILNKLIKKWIWEFKDNREKEGIGFIQEYFKQQKDLQEYIRNKAHEEVGLHLTVRLSLRHEDELKPFSINSDDFFPVRVNNDELSLKFKTELQIDEENKINAILHYNELPELKALIEEQIQKSLLENCTLHEFCYELNSSVRKKLVDALNKILGSKGREIAFLSLKSAGIPPLPESPLLIEHDAECKIKEYPTPITVKHRLWMTLNNVAKYRAASIDNLEAWVKNELYTITQTVLFEKTYVDILLDFETDKDTIKQEMQEEAQNIGYSVMQHVTGPDLAPLTWKSEGFKIEDKGIFATLDSRVKVKLNIIITGKFRELTEIKEYLNSQINVLEKIKMAVRSRVERDIHKINPERFYMHFYDPYGNNKISVEQELSVGISEELRDRFHVDDINIILKPLETEVTRRLQELQEGICSHEFEFRSRGHHEPIPFRVKFKVLGVEENGWYTFLSNNFKSRDEEIKKIGEILGETITANIKEQGVVIEDIEKLAIPTIVKAFGVSIDIITIHRLLTKIETTLQENTSKTYTKIIEMTSSDYVNQLSELQARRLAYIKAGMSENEPEFKQVNEEIENRMEKIPLLNQLTPGSSIALSDKSEEPIEKNTEEKISDAFSFEDFCKDKELTHLLTRYTNIKFPEKCFKDKNELLRIQLTISPKDSSEVTSKLQIPHENQEKEVTLSVFVSSNGFSINTPIKQMKVPLFEDSKELVFEVTPMKLGKQLVEVEFYKGADRVGYVSVETQVIENRMESVNVEL